MLIDAARSCLLVVDVQERLLPAMADADAVLAGCALLLEGARRLAVPVTLSAQYPKGLGGVVAAIADRAPDAAVGEKLHFSCAADPGIRRRLDALGQPQVVIAGIETHVCVLQTALGLGEAGFVPFVVADACGARREASHERALARLAANGVETVTAEMVVFEWLGRAGTDVFREVSKLLR